MAVFRAARLRMVEVQGLCVSPALDSAMASLARRARAADRRMRIAWEENAPLICAPRLVERRFLDE
jgi:hypothetical protein